MSEKRIVVPEGMLKVAIDAAVKSSGASTIQASSRVKAEIEKSFHSALEAALRWQSENPVVPPEQFIHGHIRKGNGCWLSTTDCIAAIKEWQRRMYLAPESEVPEGIKDMLADLDIATSYVTGREQYNKDIIEAYRRGQKTGAA